MRGEAPLWFDGGEVLQVVARNRRRFQAPWKDIWMTGPGLKADLRRYLQDGREALLWKLDGLFEYDIRRPLVPTGTNLLGLVKHQAGVELAYFGDTFGRPFSRDQLPWDEADPNSDMWATPEESREFLTGRYRRAWAHSDATIGALALDAIGHVPWWPADRNEVTLHHILVRVATDTNRHAGQADIIRELIDGTVGRTSEIPNMPPGDQAWWQSYRDQVERAAREAASNDRGPQR
jgi:hypothetical protein